MPSWRDEYLSALQERDKKEQANAAVYESYTKLADRTAAFQQAASAALRTKPQDDMASPPKPKDLKSHGSPNRGDAIAKVRQDLGEAQRSRGLMATRLQSVVEELNKLRLQSSLDTKRVDDLTKEKSVLTTGVRDRDEELRAKAKLLEDVHDETVSLTLQLNMAEEQSQRLRRENEELVDRWMKRMGQEADAMNDESKFS